MSPGYKALKEVAYLTHGYFQGSLEAIFFKSMIGIEADQLECLRRLRQLGAWS